MSSTLVNILSGINNKHATSTRALSATTAWHNISAHQPRVRHQYQQHIARQAARNITTSLLHRAAAMARIAAAATISGA